MPQTSVTEEPQRSVPAPEAVRVPVAEWARFGDCEVVDVREYPEFASGAVAAAKHVPLGRLAESAAAWDRESPVLLVCKSGKRASQGAEQLLKMGFRNVRVLEGGTEAYRTAGLPMKNLDSGVWSLERQVRFLAGGLVTLGVALGAFVHPYFFGLAAFIGLGLMVAAVTDFCGMGMLLARMPWNRKP